MYIKAISAMQSGPGIDLASAIPWHSHGLGYVLKYPTISRASSAEYNFVS